MSFLKPHNYVSLPDVARFIMQILIPCLKIKINDLGLSLESTPNTIKTVSELSWHYACRTTPLPQVEEPGTALIEIMVKKQRCTERTHERICTHRVRQLSLNCSRV